MEHPQDQFPQDRRPQDRQNRYWLDLVLSLIHISQLKNELESASQREAALQLQLREMDAGASRLQAADGQQQAKRQQAERDLQELRTQRAKLEKQVDCERIQLTVNHFAAKGDTDQATKLQNLWATPCPNLQADR